MEEISILLDRPEVIIFIWIGAFCTHILSFYRGDFKGTIPFLEKLIPGKSEAFYFRFDLIILPILGTILALVLIQPDNIKASIFTGMTWNGSMSALLTQSYKKT